MVTHVSSLLGSFVLVFVLLRPSAAAVGSNTSTMAAASTTFPATTATTTAATTANITIDRSKNAVTFMGGGFHAHSVYTALLMGLTKAVSDQLNTEPTLTATKILDRFGIIAGNSGGNWFTSQLAYSKDFLTLIESAAKDPTSAGSTYNDQWTDPLLETASTEGDNAFSKFCTSLSSDLRKKGYVAHAQMLDTIKLFMKEGDLDWSEATYNLLRTTGGVEPSLRLGHEGVNDCVKDKILIFPVSIITPGGECKQCKRKALFWRKVKIPLVSWGEYKLKDPDRDQPVFTPAKYSIRLGSGLKASAPLPFCAPAMCESLSLTYRSHVTGIPVFKESTKLKISDAQTNAGILPIADVVAASSASVGGMCTSDINNFYAGYRFAVWSSTSGADSFSIAKTAKDKLYKDNVLSQSSLKKLSNMGFHGVIDGGYTDNSGIAHAVAAGATEVVAFLVRSTDALEGLFQRGERQEHFWTSEFAMGVYWFHFQIFKEKVCNIQNQIDNFDSLDIGATGVLQSIQYGTLSVTTVDNDAFGITGGRTITIHVILVKSSLKAIGDNLGKHKYLVQELVTTLLAPTNKGKGTAKLTQMLLGTATTNATHPNIECTNKHVVDSSVRMSMSPYIYLIAMLVFYYI